jgi:hypothetical protein
MERSSDLLCKTGCMSMIVPLALVSTQRMKTVQSILEANSATWYANFSWRPGKLFDTVNRALTIFVSKRCADSSSAFSTSYQKWNSDTRDNLISTMMYCEVPQNRSSFWVPKLGYVLEQSILHKILSSKNYLRDITNQSENFIYYRTTGGLYWKVFTDFPPSFRCNGKVGHSSRETAFGVSKPLQTKTAIAALSSNFYWWWYTITSNLRDLNPSDIYLFPIKDVILADKELERLGSAYIVDLKKNSTMLVRQQKQTGKTETQSFKIQKSKNIIDQIDKVLAHHYGFTDEELDFIINYDIKYRMGSTDDGNGDDD